MKTTEKIGVLFICLGNICRSPLAEAIFKNQAKEANLDAFFDIDSAGTAAYHVGQPADPRSIAIGAKNNIDVTSLARQINHTDFDQYKYLVVMDKSNANNVLQVAHNSSFQLFQMADFSEGQLNHIADPYYGTDLDFKTMYDDLKLCSKNLLTFLKKKHEL